MRLAAVGRRLITWFATCPKTQLVIVLSGIYAATAAYRAVSIDVAAAELPAWSLATRGTLDVSGVERWDIPWFFEHAGGVYSDRFPGAIFPLVPAYWVASLLGLPEFSFAPGGISAGLVSGVAVVAMRSVLSRVLQQRELGIGVLYLAFGTGVWSVTANAPWSHTFALLGISLGLLAMASGKDFAAGLALGASVSARPTLAVAVLGIGLGLALLRRDPRPVVSVGLGAVPGVLFLVAYNGAMFGAWGPSNGHELEGNIHVRWLDIPVNFGGALFSPLRGLVFYYPVLGLSVMTVRRAWRDAADWERAAAIGAVLTFLVQFSLNRYSGGDTFFGPRLLIEPLALATPVLARAVALFGRDHSRRVVAVALGAGIALHAFGAIIVPY